MSEVGAPPAPGAAEVLYREVVLEHYRHPRHREPLSDPDCVATLHNPVCGDQVRVELRLERDRIREISARTRGCSIAVAAGSVMAELVLGQPPVEAEALRRALERIVAGDPAPEGADERLRAFAAVAPLRSRHRCALLPWEALREALASLPGRGRAPTR